MGFSITGAHNECLSEGCRAMALYAEIERLRSALETIADLTNAAEMGTAAEVNEIAAMVLNQQSPNKEINNG